MKQNWNDVKWIFEPDGTLIDIYVQEVSINDWEKLIDYLNENFQLNYGISDDQESQEQIDKEYAIKYLQDESGEKESKSVSIDLGGITANCHFFLPDQIEFDLDPKEIKSSKDFEKVESFMKSISKTLKNQVTLTGENNIEFPLIKVDLTKDIVKALTENEAREFYKTKNKLTKQYRSLQTKFMMKFSRENVKERLLKSANEPYESTKKSKNVW